MRQILPNDLRVACNASSEDARRWAPYLNAAAVTFDIQTLRRQCMWLANVAIESDRLTRVVENLNYMTARRIMMVWPGRFADLDAAQAYVGRPEALASYVYANRLGNGSQQTGDGWRYRGRGLLQTTGKLNYERVGTALGLDLLNYPELLESPEHAAQAAGYEWRSRRCNEMADRGDVRATRKAINGPACLHLIEVSRLYENALILLPEV